MSSILESLSQIKNLNLTKLDQKTVGIGAAVGLTAFGITYLTVKRIENQPPTGVPKYTIRHEPKQHGGKVFGEALKNQGVKFVFTLVGGHISPILVGCEEMGIKVIDVRHEVNAAFAADSVSRLSGIPGVAIVTAGPGVTNTITAVKNAQVAQSPLILIGGATSDLVKGMGSLQDVDQISLIKPHVKWWTHVGAVKDIIPAVEKAFWISQSGTPGPVFLEVPLDVIYQEELARKTYESKKTSPSSLFERVANWYMTYHLDRIFGGINELTFHTPLPVTFAVASKREIGKAVELIKKAKRPFLMIGSQTMLLHEELVSNKFTNAVNKIGIPAGLSGMARGVLGKNNKLQVKQKNTRRKAFKEADLIILAGLPLDFRLDYGRTINSKATLINVNRDHHDLTKNSWIRPATLAINGDACSFIIQLADALGEISTNWAQWNLDLLRSEEQNEQGIDGTKSEKQQYVNPIFLCQEIEKAADDTAIFVADGGDFVGTAAYILRPRSPLSWLDPGPFGTLGVGSAFAMGAKLCNPDSEVWIIFGDGAVGFSIAEFDTFVRHKIPVIAVVGNDAAWMQILREQDKMLGSSVACLLQYTDYQDVVKGFGAEGIIVRDKSEVAGALQKAKQIVRERQVPVLVNVLISKSDFREGSISV